MNSIFSFRRGSSQPADANSQPAAQPEANSQAALNAEVVGVFASPADFSASDAGLTPAINLQPFLQNLLDLLKAYLPANQAGLPANSVSLVQLKHRPLGLGGHRGTLTYQGMDVAEVHGGFLEGVVRFDFWALDPGSLNNQTAVLQAKLLSDSPVLRQKGLRQFQLSESSDSSTSTSPQHWRKFLDYTVLYEYQYVDSGGAASLIASVPIHSDVDGSPGSQEQTEVHDWMILWDQTAASPLLVAQDPAHPVVIYGIAVAAYLPSGGPAGSVTISHGATVVHSYNSLADFMAAVLNAGQLGLVYPPLPLQPGEQASVHDFEVGVLPFKAPIALKGGGDTFKISFSESSFPVNNLSQVYLRALPGPLA